MTGSFAKTLDDHTRAILELKNLIKQANYPPWLLAHSYETDNFQCKIFQKSNEWRTSKTKIQDLEKELENQVNFSHVSLEAIEPKSGKNWVKASFLSNFAKFSFIKALKASGKSYITVPLTPRELMSYEDLNRKQAIAEVLR